MESKGNTKTKTKKKSKHTNSTSVNDLVMEIKALENQLRKLDIAVTYPDNLQHDHTPMIGHTKGNTSNNRKVIKRHQVTELTKVVTHLRSLLPAEASEDIASSDESEDEEEWILEDDRY